LGGGSAMRRAAPMATLVPLLHDQPWRISALSGSVILFSDVAIRRAAGRRNAESHPAAIVICINEF
jgi:hypothetical protein